MTRLSGFRAGVNIGNHPPRCFAMFDHLQQAVVGSLSGMLIHDVAKHAAIYPAVERINHLVIPVVPNRKNDGISTSSKLIPEIEWDIEGNN